MTPVQTSADNPAASECARALNPAHSEPRRANAPSLAWIVAASSLGSLIEWYDFYLYGSLAVFLGGQFYPDRAGNFGILMSLTTMAVGFAIRPLGGLVFGRLGDGVGRKNAFVLSLVLMGAATTCTGLLPTYRTWGWMAPLLLITIRLLQGLAVGGEVGGAMTYVVEHAPERKRGFYTGLLNVTGPLGIVLSLVVIYACRSIVGEEHFRQWGWRIPFLLSSVLLLLSLYFRLSLRETPVFERLKSSGRLSRQPLRDTLLDPKNRATILAATFGVTAGQAVMGVTSNVYATQFMQAVLKIDIQTATFISTVALVFSIPIYILSGWLSDIVGRRKLMIAGMVCAIVFYVPIYMAMEFFSRPVNVAALCLLCWIQVSFTALIVGSTFAFLTEIFPTRVRTTSVTIPFNIGNGIIGGFSPLISLWLTFATKIAYIGLLYPIAVLLVTVCVNLVFIRETFMNRILDEVNEVSES
ncbi:MAG TPA: MFS transporter [Caulobacteraceae bacterium]|nr:MFS transporter [Caulobacteraceae bacterium]